MAKQHVIATVRAILDGWQPVGITKPAIKYPNGEGDTPADAEPFLDVQFPVANGSRTTHSRSYLEEGTVRVVVLAERGGGLDWTNARSEEIEELFRSVKRDGVEFQTPNTAAFDDNNDNGNYFVASIVVPYKYFYSIT